MHLFLLSSDCRLGRITSFKGRTGWGGTQRERDQGASASPIKAGQFPGWSSQRIMTLESLHRASRLTSLPGLSGVAQHPHHLPRSLLLLHATPCENNSEASATCSEHSWASSQGQACSTMTGWCSVSLPHEVEISQLVSLI